MKMRDLMNIINEDTIAFQRNGFPVELHGEAEIQREVEAGHLDANTEVTLYSGNHVSGYGEPVMKRAGEVPEIAKHLPKRETRTILSIECDGHPTDLFDDSDIEKAIARGDLTPETDVTISRPDQRPQIVKASRVSKIATHFDGQ